jgi:hypothetical protein
MKTKKRPHWITRRPQVVLTKGDEVEPGRRRPGVMQQPLPEESSSGPSLSSIERNGASKSLIVIIDQLD